MISRRHLCLSLLASSFSSGVFAASTDTRIIVPYPAGGPLDAAARILAEALKPSEGKIIVENIAGAAGARGMLAAKGASADAKTWVMGAVATLAINPFLYRNLAYTPNDFSPIALLSDVPNVLIMTPTTMKTFGFTHAEDVLDFMRSHPGRLNGASGGNGSAGHLAIAQLNAEGFQCEHIPYAGAAPALFSVISGETDFIFDNYANARAGIADGSLKTLALTTHSNFEELPGVPTMKELGIDMNLSTWFGLLAPQACPTESIQAIFDKIALSLKNPDVFDALKNTCGTVRLENPAVFAQRIAREQEHYRHLIDRINLTL